MTLYLTSCQLKQAEEAFSVQLKDCKNRINAQQKELDTFKDLRKQFEKTQVLTHAGSV